MKATNCGNNKPYEPLCARPVTRVDLAAPLLLLFPLEGIGDCLPAGRLPFFLSLFLFVLNSDIQFNFKLVKLQKPYNIIHVSVGVQYNEFPITNVYINDL